MPAIKKRIEQLEGAGSRDKHPLEGWITVDLTDALAKAGQRSDFHHYGFSVEELNPPPRLPVPRRAEGKGRFDFKKMEREAKRRSTFMERLKSMPHAERERLAKKHGYRLVYPLGQ
ncbi:MAG TPA: hypothetical protein VKA63_01615 [Candidatus Krumholzibacteria bacterium]|nr:hypothetical protein [Candidatus Krumholzibacteria bacterium]